jgi:hypothetical protein
MPVGVQTIVHHDGWDAGDLACGTMLLELRAAWKEGRPDMLPGS